MPVENCSGNDQRLKAWPRGLRPLRRSLATLGMTFMKWLMAAHEFSSCAGLTGYAHISSFVALNTGPVTAFARTPTDQIRADAERLSHIILEMQRCFVLRLCKQLAPGNVSFPQFFLLAYLDRKEVLTMSEIAKKMGHTTAAASGLVARLENLGYVMRSVARDDRRKVMVCITSKGSALVRRIREEMVGNILKILNHLTPDEQKAWLHIYSKIYDYCQSK
jgi:DNA-binding MarR family transcriptional regulator